MKTKTTLFVAFLAIVFSIISYAQVQNIAHRGCSSLAPENTYSAWVKAIETGADYFELDIQLSSDDSLVIMHDATVDRTTNSTGTISAMTYADLRLLDAGSWFSAAFAGEKIPTFAEALQLAKSDGTIDIVAEIKSTNPAIVAKVVAMIQAFGMQSRVIVSSFTFTQIAESKSIDTSIEVQLFGTITNAMIDQVAAINGEWVGSGGTITQALNDYAHSKNVSMNAWTINTGSQMIALIALGVDGITTNYPQTFVAVTDSTEPEDVIINSALATGETDVTLNWQAAADAESGVTGYEIYRDVNPNPTVLYATVGVTTDYVDHTLVENQIFYYRIKAVNGAGLKSVNFSNEVSATTLADLTKPVVSYVTSVGDTSTVYVQFSELVEQLTAETKTNYTINKGIIVLSAELTMDLQTVKLTTTHLSDTSYTITVRNVKDRAITPNTMVTASIIFIHKNITPNVVAYYKLDDLQVVGADTVLYDGSANANNGLVKNGAFISSGYLGNAMEFDGVDDFVQFASSPSFDINGSAVTVSVWTKLAYLPNQLPGAYGPLFDSDADQYVLYEDRGNNELRFKVATSVTAERPGIPAADLVTGQWIHVVGVYNGSQAKVFLNGVLKDTHIITGTVKTGQIAMLGKSGVAGTPSYFKGKIDNVLVLNSALTDAEVLALYENTKTPGVNPSPSVVTLNAPVVNETAVTLSWSQATTYESLIMGYEIYRSATPDASTLIATVDRNMLSYVDNTDTENQTFYYRVRAKNTVALKSAEYSNEVTAATTTDTKAPNAAFITSREENTKVVIEFSELVEQASAENISNYSIKNGITVTGAYLCLDGKTVILTTSPMSVGSYHVILNNIKDIAAAPNTILSNSYYLFNHTGFPSNLVAYYSMDGTRVDTLFDASANANNGVFMNSTGIDKGYSGNSLVFNGVDTYVQFASSPSFDISGGLVSVSVWTKLEYLPTEMLLGTGPLFDSELDNYVLYEDKGNKELRFKAVNTSSQAARPGIPQADLISGQWINVVGVFDGTNAMIYYNGVKKGVLPLAGAVRTGQVAMLGKSATTGVISYFKGNIDNVAVFDRVLSEAEILDMYNNYKVAADYIIPVELTSFSAQADNGKINLVWETSTETNNYGYEIQRSSDKINFTAIGFVKGAGTSTEKQNYTFTDNSRTTNKVYYRLKQIDFDGSFWYSQVVEAANVIPTEFALSQNFPNPFNPVTTIKFQLPADSKVSLKVYDILGSEVATLVNEVKEAGYYELSFNGTGLASGTYFFRIQADNFVQTKKMILMK